MEPDESKEFISTQHGYGSYEEIPLCLNDNKPDKENVDGSNHSDPVVGSYFLDVPNVFGINFDQLYKTDIKTGIKTARKCDSPQRRHSFNVASVQKYRKHSIDDTQKLTPIARIGALSSNFLHASMSNLHQLSSPKSLISFFTHNGREVRAKYT